MNLLSEATVRNDGVIFRQIFNSRRRIMDQGGVIYGTPTVNDGFLISNLNTDRIVYTARTMEGLGTNKLTVRARLRTPPAFSAITFVVGPWDSSGGGMYRWIMKITNAGRVDFHVPATITDTATYSYQNPGTLSTSTEYIIHWVFDGALANPNRTALYIQGANAAKSDTAAIPATMMLGSIPLCIAGAKTAALSQAGYIIRDVCVWLKALSAQECLDDVNDKTFGGE